LCCQTGHEDRPDYSNARSGEVESAQTDRKPGGEARIQAVCGRVEADREGRVRLHKMAGGQTHAVRVLLEA
jgi:hypothetical protein